MYKCVKSLKHTSSFHRLVFKANMKNSLHFTLLLCCLSVTRCTNISEENVSRNSTIQYTTKNNMNISADKLDDSSSQFVPSFSPFIQREDIQSPHSNPHQDQPHFHLNPFGESSPFDSYQHMRKNEISYAWTYPYKHHHSQFTPSEPDSFLETYHRPTSTSNYYPQTFHHRQPYAEEYPPNYERHPYVPDLSQHYHPPNYFSSLVRQHSNQLDKPNPHAFHSVVNYGHINLHHGDHHEHHDNGNTVGTHPHLPGYLSSIFRHTAPIYPSSPGNTSKPSSMEDEVVKEEKVETVEKVEPK